MEWLLFVAALGLAAGLGMSRARNARDARDGAEPGAANGRRAAYTSLDDRQPTISQADLKDLESRFAAVEAADGHAGRTLLAVRLETLQRRSVPVRAVRRAPGPRVARLCFANGTVMLARANEPGQLFALAMGVHEQAHVRLASWTPHPDGAELRFVWAGGGSAQLRAVGLDQSD